MSDIDFISRITTETAEVRKKRLAKALINCKYAAPGYAAARLQSFQADAYYNLRPYPIWAFSDWKTEDRGPLPRCMPLPQGVTNKSADWLFGRDVQITIPGNLELEKSFRKAWLQNQMRSQSTANARTGGVQGTLVLKWSYDETAEVPLRFQYLSGIDHCRLFCDPHDRNTLLMLRIQYPVWNPQNGEYYLYREEWTDEEEVHYLPLPCKIVPFVSTSYGGHLYQSGSVAVLGTNTDPDTYSEWEIRTRSSNPFGMIPAVPIRNVDTGGLYGAGDLWGGDAGGIFRSLDRINLAYHLMDRSNQFDSTPTPVFIDAKSENDALTQPLKPGDALAIESSNDAAEGSRQAKVELLEPAGKLREPMMDYACAYENRVLDSVGSVMLDAEEITNKGNLTSFVARFIFLPLIQATEAKKQTYGENGLVKAVEKCALSLKNLADSGKPVKKFPGIESVNVANEESYDAQLKWPDYFPLSEEEKGLRVTRVTEEMGSGVMPHERAIEIVAQVEGVDDVQAMKDELKKEMARQETLKKAEADTATGEAKQAMNPPKPASIGAK